MIQRPELGIKQLDRWPHVCCRGLLALLRQVARDCLPSPVCSLLRWGSVLPEWKQIF